MIIVRKLTHRAWNSTTITTWTSFGTRSLNLVFVLPLLLRAYSASEVALWQMLAGVIGLQLLVDFGFGSTFSRLCSYAMGGVTDFGQNCISSTGGGEAPNWILLGRLFGTMRWIYRRGGWAVALLLATIGTSLLVRRIAALQNTAIETTVTDAWIAWAVVIIASGYTFSCNCYSAFLQGTNHVALVRRWETFFGLGTTCLSALVVVCHGGVLPLIAANQGMAVLSSWRDRRLCQSVMGGRFRVLPAIRLERNIVADAWKPAWRSGVGVLASFGLVQISALIYAQSPDSAAVATYLIGLRLVQTISQVCQAPFYSKLPLLARLWAEKRTDEQVKVARRGMILSYWMFVLPFVALGLTGPALFEYVHSHTPFPDPKLWLLLGSAIFVERYGAMHLQLYSVTNRIIWHIANGISGTIFIVVALLAFPRIGVYAIPLGMLTGNCTFYAWYSARHSYRAMGFRWPQFDLTTVVLPALCFAGYVVIAVT